MVKQRAKEKVNFDRVGLGQEVSEIYFEVTTTTALEKTVNFGCNSSWKQIYFFQVRVRVSWKKKKENLNTLGKTLFSRVLDCLLFVFAVVFY